MAIPEKIVRNLDQQGIIRTMSIDLSDNDEDRASIIEVLRSKLYSNKVLAPIREYACNAADSHVEAGCGSTPIKVTLPTMLFPELRIRDYGIGLTPEEIERIYIKYGRSTKRNTNAQTGQLGLGCKSAFAYGDNFIVISYKDGVKTTYNLTINGVCTVFSSEPMVEDEKVGIEVVVPVDTDDVRQFQTEALNFFKYWKVCPELLDGEAGQIEELRAELAVKPLFSDDTWEIRPTGNKSYYSYDAVDGVAVMGNVPYPINWKLVRNKIILNDNESVLFDFISCNQTILHVNIGELDFSASRESLEYTEKTCKGIVARVRTILDSIFNILDTKIKSAPTYWDALLIYNQIFGRGDEKMFRGDVYRLEAYYKGKFEWNGIKIQSGTIDDLDCWDMKLGYGKAGWKDASGQALFGSDPCFMTYDLSGRHGKMRCHVPNDYGYNKITASNKVTILIHDLEKPVLVKAAVRYMFNKHNPTSRPDKVYFLRFKDDAQRAEFFKVMHFDSVPVTYVSQIQTKIKEWLKESRVNSGGGSYVREPQQIRCFVPANRLNKYSSWDDVDDVELDRETIDLHEEEGYYINYDSGNGQASVTGVGSIYNISHLSHYTKALFDALGETVQYVYALPARNRSAKWFEEAKKEGQWTDLGEYFKENEEQILHGKTALIAKAAKYFSTCSEADFGISIRVAEKLLPLLTNKNGVMAKLCSEINTDFRTHSNLANALNYFGLGKSLVEDCDTDFAKMFKDVEKAYPMLTVMENNRYLKNNERSYDNYISGTLLNRIADYINIVDAQTVSQPVDTTMDTPISLFEEEATEKV